MAPNTIIFKQGGIAILLLSDQHDLKYLFSAIGVHGRLTVAILQSEPFLREC